MSRDSGLDLHNRLRNKLSEDWTGWELQEIVDSKRPLHYKLVHQVKPHAKIFIYATDKRALTYSDVDMVIKKLIDCRREDKGIRAVIYVTNEARIPHPIENYANRYEINIRHI